MPDRATPFDAFLNRKGLIMDEMEPGSRIGVLSHRGRAPRCRRCGRTCDFQILRGGVDRAMETHMRRSEIDGLVLPASVTEHLGIQGIVAEIFAPEFILPGPGQGILVVARPRATTTRPANCWPTCIPAATGRRTGGRARPSAGA